MDPVSVALGVGGIASSLINNAHSQSNYNAQMDFSRYQYEDSKRYNSAQAQVQRLRAAGISPALAFGQNAGTATAVSQPGNPVSSSPLDLNGLAAVSSGISLNDAQKQNLEANTKREEAEADNQLVSNQFAEENWKSLLYNRDVDSWFKDKQSDLAKLQLRFEEGVLKDKIRSWKLDNELKDAQVVAQDLSNMYLPSKLPAEVNELISRQIMNNRLGIASVTSAHAAIMQALNKEMENKALYGETNVERKNYSKAVFNKLVQDRRLSESQEFKNYGFEDKITPYTSKKRAQYDPVTKTWHRAYLHEPWYESFKHW